MITIRVVMVMMVVVIPFVAAGLSLMLNVHLHDAKLLCKRLAVSVRNKVLKACRCICVFKSLGQFLRRCMAQACIPANGLK